VLAVAVMGSLLAGSVGAEFEQRLATAGLDVPVTTTIADELAQGVPPEAGQLPPGTPVEEVRAAGFEAFVASTTVALRWATVAAVLALAVTVALILSSRRERRRRRRRSPPRAPALCSAPASGAGRPRSG
jgi:hypothetical protein